MNHTMTAVLFDHIALAAMLIILAVGMWYGHRATGKHIESAYLLGYRAGHDQARSERVDRPSGR